MGWLDRLQHDPHLPLKTPGDGEPPWELQGLMGLVGFLGRPLVAELAESLPVPKCLALHVKRSQSPSFAFWRLTEVQVWRKTSL